MSISISITGAYKAIITSYSGGFVIEGHPWNYSQGNLTNSIGSNGLPSTIIVKSDSFTYTSEVYEMLPVISTDTTQSNDSNGQSFIFKGPDSISGAVNGLLNIAPSMGTVATFFNGQFIDKNFNALNLGGFTTVTDSINNLQILNKYDSSGLITGAEMLVDGTDTNLSVFLEHEPTGFDYMQDTTFATFDSFVNMNSRVIEYTLDSITPNLSTPAIFTPLYKYDFAETVYFSLYWVNDAGESLDVLKTTDSISENSYITLTLQDSSGLTYGGSTSPATLTSEVIIIESITSEETTQVVATDTNFKLFEDALLTIDNYSVNDRTINIIYVPVLDEEKLSHGDLAGALTSQQTLYTETEIGVDMLYNDGLIYTVENQQGIYGSLSLDTLSNYKNFSFWYQSDFGEIYQDNIGWKYTLDNSDPDTIALNEGDIGNDIFTINISDGVNTVSEIVEISVQGENNDNHHPVMVMGTPSDLAITYLDQKAIEGVKYEFDSSLFFSDEDGDILTYSAKMLTPSRKVVPDSFRSDKDLPGWLYIDPDTGMLSGTPNNLEEGFIDVSIVAEDGHGKSVSFSHSIQVYRYDEYGMLDALGTHLLVGTTNNDHVTALKGADLIYTSLGNDVVNLIADSTWTSGYVAKNVGNSFAEGTNETIAIEGLNRFNDVIDSGNGIDVLNLTSGNDAFFIDDAYSNHHRDLTLTSTMQGIDSTARVANIETINAGNGNDIVDLTSVNFMLADAVEINGEAGNDVLWGANGDDTINGGEGNDTIFGGAGIDTLTGGAGADVFQFTATSGSDVITDFDIKNDTIELYYRKGEDHVGVFILDETLMWQTSDPDENGIVNKVLIDLSTSISKVDSAIVNASLDGLNKETIATELQLFKETLSAFDILGPADTDIGIKITPSIDKYLLSIGDLVGALTTDPMFYLETSLGANVNYANGITYYIEDQQGIYGSFGFGFPIEGEFKISDISTGLTDLRSSINPINEDSSARYTSDYATMHLSNGFSNNWPTWYYVLDNNDVDTISATTDFTHIDTFTISATNGIDVVSQQIDINIFEDVGLPFDPNTMLGQFQSLYSNDDYLYMDSRSVSVSLDDLNNFDPFITFVEIV
jgi:VCBS repeat-containing protein